MAPDMTPCGRMRGLVTRHRADIAGLAPLIQPMDSRAYAPLMHYGCKEFDARGSSSTCDVLRV